MTSQKRKLIGAKEFKGVSIKIGCHQDTKIGTSVCIKSKNINLSIINNLTPLIAFYKL
jgi:hypothetical protein